MVVVGILVMLLDPQMGVVLMTLNVGSIMSVGFEKVLLMQNPLNLVTSQVIDTYIYEVGLKSPIPPALSDCSCSCP